MKYLKVAAGALATLVVALAISLYGTHVARSSDHQDSPTVVARPGADITDVYVYPAPDNAANVVLAMDVYPLIPAGMSTSSNFAFDPSVLYQFKIANAFGAGDSHEHLVIQFAPTASGQGQSLTMYGPAAPNEAGTTNTTVATTGTIPFNAVTTVMGGKVQVFAGTRRDPFFFDLAQFFKIIPDRNAGYHAPGQTVPPPTATSFNGFAAGSSCSTAAPSNFLAPYNVLQIAVELPKTMLAPTTGTLGKIGVWATTATTSGQ